MLAIILPLAVQNRQIVDIYLNPFSLLDANSAAFSMPLFLALLLAICIGLICGLILGRITGPKKSSKAHSAAADILARMPKATASMQSAGADTMAKKQTMLESRTSSAQTAREALSQLQHPQNNDEPK